MYQSLTIKIGSNVLAGEKGMLNHDRMKDFSVGVLPFALVLGVVAALMLLEPHLSGTVLILGIGAVLMFVGGTGLRWFLLAAAGAAAGRRGGASACAAARSPRSSCAQSASLPVSLTVGTS